MRDLGYKWQKYQLMPLLTRNWKYDLRAYIGKDGEDGILYSSNEIFTDFKKDFKIFSQGFTIGNVPSAYLELTVRKKATGIPANAKVRLEVCIVGGEQGDTDWIPWGTYFVDTRDVQRDSITLKCFDRMLYGDQDFWSAVVRWAKETEQEDFDSYWAGQNVTRDPLSKEHIFEIICWALKTELDPRMSLDDIYLPNKTKIPPEATVRDVLSWVGMSNGMNWVITDEDKLRGVVLENFNINSNIEENDTLLMMSFSNNPQIFAVTPSQFSVDELNNSMVDIMGAVEGDCPTDYPTDAVRVISSDTVKYGALVQIFGDSKTTNVEGEQTQANYWIWGDETQTPILELSNPLISSEKDLGEAQVEYAFNRIKNYEYRSIIADTVIVDPAVEFGDSIVLGQYAFEIVNISWFGMLAANIESPLDGNAQSEFPFKAPQAKTFQRVSDSIAGTKVLLEVTDKAIRGEIKEITKEDGILDTKLEITSGRILSTVSENLEDELIKYSTITQTTESISTLVSKSANYESAHRGETPPTDTAILWFDTNANIYKYYNTISETWETVEGGSIYSIFEQTVDGFKFKNNVKIDGSLILTENLKLTSGNITWETAPVCVLYARTKLSTPFNAYESYDNSSSDVWHKDLDTNDKYISFNFQGGIAGKWTLTEPLSSTALSIANSANSTANFANGTASSAESTANTANSTANTASSNVAKLANGTYTTGTFISGTEIASPTISAGKMVSTVFEGGIFNVTANENGQSTGMNIEYLDEYAGISYENAGRLQIEENAFGGPEFKIEANNGVKGWFLGNWEFDTPPEGIVARFG